MPLVQDDEPGSWRELSKNWPRVQFTSRTEYKEAWRYCVKSTQVPYGAYVDVSGYKDSEQVPPFIIRFETNELREKVLEHLRKWKGGLGKRRPRVENGSWLRRPPKAR